MMPTLDAAPPSSADAALGGLRAALGRVQAAGETVLRVATALSADCELALHYAHHHAGVPAVAATRDEPVVLYTGVRGARMPVLMGLFGRRARNRALLPGLAQLRRRIADWPTHGEAVRWAEPEGRSVVALDGHPALTELLPVLTHTPDDAGPYITTGIVVAEGPQGEVAASVHRLCVKGPHEVTIWMLPGRRLRQLYEQALAGGASGLPVSINIGCAPASYIAAALPSAALPPGHDKLRAAAVLAGHAVALARGPDGALHFSDSQVVLHGRIVARTRPEAGSAGCSMPEFLGCMGDAQAALPVIELSHAVLRREPIYQTLLGPGREQSEIQALGAEIALLARLPAYEGMEVVDAHCPSAGGGLLQLVLQVRGRPGAAEMQRLRSDALRLAPLAKFIQVVDEDVDIHNPEDLWWALISRAQFDVDARFAEDQPGIPVDPSQRAAYRLGAYAGGRTTRVFLDCTVPPGQRAAFERCYGW